MEQTHCTMRLLTDELVARFRELAFQKSDPIAICKLIHRPTGDTIYMVEYHPGLNTVIGYCEHHGGGRPVHDGFGIYKFDALETETDPRTGDPLFIRDPTFKERPLKQAVLGGHRLLFQQPVPGFIILNELRVLRHGFEGKHLGLLTTELRARFAEVGRQEHVNDPLVIAKFFTPSGEATWFATEYYPEDNTCFGYVQGLSPQPHDDEWGYFSIAELEEIRVSPFGLPIERDLYWTEKRFSQIKDIRKRR